MHSGHIIILIKMQISNLVRTTSQYIHFRSMLKILLFTFPEHLRFFVGSVLLNNQFSVQCFVDHPLSSCHFLFVIVLSDLLRYTASAYRICISNFSFISQGIDFVAVSSNFRLDLELFRGCGILELFRECGIFCSEGVVFFSFSFLLLHIDKPRLNKCHV